ncbi:quinone-dependent dihydroorotate dehydrogenase [Balneolales bacterium ANBcel1]|nr:quinone-dependent dihydroorotate dehydrogenase [Balneolales bacterium ANBcel1]
MYKEIIQPLFFRLDPEKAHHLAVTAGERLASLPVVNRILTKRYIGKWPNLEQFCLGMPFPLPVGVAAGFDKNARHTHLLRASGFGFAEYGSISALSSVGNPAPRLFRLPSDRGLVNRMGLNNEGAETICRRISTLKYRSPYLFHQFPVGINIAKTHSPEITGDAAIRDYITSYLEAKSTAGYITLNISCPNTREGKTFEDRHALKDLIDGVKGVVEPEDPPLLVKFSPDSSTKELDAMLDVCEEQNVSGYVLSNTSAGREGLVTPEKNVNDAGAGGLSGAPLFEGNIARVMHVRRQVPKSRVIIGCGGIDAPERAVRVLKAGANLLQVYTGFIYEGPSLLPSIHSAISDAVIKNGHRSMRTWLAQHHPE